MKSKGNWKQVLMSIFIGALVAFLTSLIDGLVDFMQGQGNNIAGGITSTIRYAVKNIRA